MATTLRRAMVWLQHPWLIVGVALCLRVAWMVAYAPWDAPNERLITRAPNPDAGSYQEVALVLLRYWNKPGQAIVEMPEAIDSIIIRAPGYSLVMAVALLQRYPLSTRFRLNAGATEPTLGTLAGCGEPLCNRA